jgi:hypothetical protein
MSRQVMWFLLPRDLKALVSDSGNDRDHVPIYINPQSIDIKENKLVNHSLAKGGYIVQYWGEELPIMAVSGTTGSGGIEAINILRNIYRYEQLAMKRILVRRAQNFAENSTNSREDTSSATTLAGLASAADGLFSGIASNIKSGAESAVEGFTNAYNGISEDNKKVGLIPSLGAFAVSMDIFFQGCKYRGFFKEFSVQESADRPGLFDYSFTFMVTRKTGVRKNFMPWHRNPTRLGGFPRTASIPIAGAATNELSFPTNAEYGNTQEQMIGGRLSSDFNQTQEGEDPDDNSQPVNRRSVF